MVVKRASRWGKKRGEENKKRDEKYSEPSRVDEWTFINAVTATDGVAGASVIA